MDCEIMRSIATFLPLSILLSVFICISVISIPLVIYVIIRISRNQLYHLNTRVLLIAHGIGLVVHLTDRIFYHGWDLYLWWVVMLETSPCDIISTSERCFAIRIPFNFAMWVCVTSTPAIVLERWIATRRISNYQRDRRPWLCIVVQLIISVSLLSLTYSKQRFGGFQYYCMGAKPELPFHVFIALSITFVLQIVSVLTFRNLIKVNKKLRSSLHNKGSTLTNRYQVEESLRSLQTLFQPVHIMFACQFTYSIITFLVIFFNSNFSRPVFFTLMEMCILIPEYSIAFSITVIRIENKISVQGTKDIKRKIDINPDAYFEHYKIAWDA